MARRDGYRRAGQGTDEGWPSSEGERPAAPGLDPWLVLRSEIDRSRRYGHPLTLIRLSPAPVAPGVRAPRRSLWHGRAARWAGPTALVADLRPHVRTCDAVWAHGGLVFLLLPETERPAAEILVARLRERGPAPVRDAELRLASFPRDGFTGEALLAGLAGGGLPLGETLPGPEPAPVVSRLRRAATLLAGAEGRGRFDRGTATRVEGVPESAD